MKRSKIAAVVLALVATVGATFVPITNSYAWWDYGYYDDWGWGHHHHHHRHSMHTKDWLVVGGIATVVGVIAYNNRKKAASTPSAVVYTPATTTSIQSSGFESTTPSLTPEEYAIYKEMDKLKPGEYCRYYGDNDQLKNMIKKVIALHPEDFQYEKVEGNTIYFYVKR